MRVKPGGLLCCPHSYSQPYPMRLSIHRCYCCCVPIRNVGGMVLTCHSPLPLQLVGLCSSLRPEDPSPHPKPPPLLPAHIFLSLRPPGTAAAEAAAAATPETRAAVAALDLAQAPPTHLLWRVNNEEFNRRFRHLVGRAAWGQGLGSRAAWGQGSGSGFVWGQGSGFRAAWGQGLRFAWGMELNCAPLRAPGGWPGVRAWGPGF